MNRQYTILYMAIGIIILLLTIILIMYIRHRRIVRKKSYGIIRQIQKQDELAKELERSKIEKETLLKIINKGIQEIKTKS
ncbi:MAG: hypothetical protein LBH32_11645 [Dysgonamonadaceae bacterium]|nr:hypothetical protein [Dysgonamonadaceae bacterium]